jgi:hypothetical protein
MHTLWLIWKQLNLLKISFKNSRIARNFRGPCYRLRPPQMTGLLRLSLLSPNCKWPIPQCNLDSLLEDSSDVLLDIRSRFLPHVKRDNGFPDFKHTHDDQGAIDSGNRVAHNPDPVNDSRLYLEGTKARLSICTATTTACARSPWVFGPSQSFTNH